MYRTRVEAMSVVERVRRAEALFCWTRDYLARTIAADSTSMSQYDLKWEVALRQYGADPTLRALIDGLRGRAPR